MAIGKQNKTLTQQVMFWAKASQSNSPLFNRVTGQVEVTAGQINFRVSLPYSASNVLEPMLHPAAWGWSFSVTLHISILSQFIPFTEVKPCESPYVMYTLKHWAIFKNILPAT